MKDKLESLVGEMVERDIPFRLSLAEFEKLFIHATLSRCEGNLSKAAVDLGIHRNTLSKKIAFHWPDGIAGSSGFIRRRRSLSNVWRGVAVFQEPKSEIGNSL